MNNITSKTLNTYFAFWALFLIAAILSPLLFILCFYGVHVVVVIVGIASIVIGGVVFQYLLLYQCWKLIPADIARTTPGKAVGFSFIPIFNLYWMFIAYAGLSKDMNKTFQQRGIQYRVSEGLGLAFCVLFLVYLSFQVSCDVVRFLVTLELLSGNFFGMFALITLVGGLVGLVWLFVAIAFLRSVKNGAIALLEEQKEPGM